MTARRMLFGGGGRVTSTELAVSALLSPGEGGGVWFGGPRAIRNGSTTILGYQTGDSGGDVKNVIITNSTKTVSSTATLYNNFIVDDHSPPSFVVRPDGVIMAAFAYHVGELYVGIGASAGVLPAQAQVTNITSQVGALSGSAGYTYASILYLDDEDRYYIFFRYHDVTNVPYVGYTYSDDDGATWSAKTLVQQITYHRVAKNGTDRLDLVVSDHPDHGQGDDGVTHTNIYHLYYDGTWHKSDGTTLTPVIFNTAATQVYDGTTSRAWLWDIAIGGDGHPRIVYVTYAEPYATGAWTYGWARWTGSAWENKTVADAGTTIVTSGSEHYAGGIVLDPEDPNRVLYSSNSGGTFQIYLATTLDNGTTWSTTQLTSDSDKNVRPFWVSGHEGTLQAGWWYGTYTTYLSYSQGTKVLGR